MADLIKASGIKKYIKANGLRVSKDSIEQLERKMSQILTAAMQAAKNDRRSTVRPEDII